jgi:hypothetical protein
MHCTLPGSAKQSHGCRMGAADACLTDSGNFSMFHLPNSVYRYVPFAYVIAGVSTLLLVGNLIGVFSGLLLVIAGLLVFYSRLENRITTQELMNYKQCAQALTCPNKRRALNGE